MEYTEFGKTQLRVSRMCLGTWGIGGAGWDSYSDESRMDAIKAAVDCGINFIDTAPAYNGGRAEQYIGEVVHKLGVRKEVILATKCGNEFINGKYVRCGSADKIMRECEESLRNLKTDYIDVYLVHWPDPNVPMEETMDALNTLKKQGKILHIGVYKRTDGRSRKILCYRSISATVFYGRSEMGAADPVGLCSENGSYDLWNARRRHFNRKIQRTQGIWCG